MDSNSFITSLAENSGSLAGLAGVLVGVGKYLINQWAKKDKENSKLRAKLADQNVEHQGEIFSNNFLKVEKDLDGLGTSMRSFKAEMYNHIKMFTRLEFQMERMLTDIQDITKEQEKFEKRMREIAKQEIKFQAKNLHLVEE